MKEVGLELKDGIHGTVMIPDNCQHPFICLRSECHAVHPSHPECNCRWCVYNKEFCQAKQKEE